MMFSAPSPAPSLVSALGTSLGGLTLPFFELLLSSPQPTATAATTVASAQIIRPFMALPPYRRSRRCAPAATPLSLLAPSAPAPAPTSLRGSAQPPSTRRRARA